MSLLREGFNEIGRKVQRVSLQRQIRAAGQARAAALRALGKRAAETGVTGDANEDLKARISATQAKDKELQSQAAALEENRKKLEQQRDADVARFNATEQELAVKKNPLDSELFAQQKTVTRSQQQVDDARRRLAQLPQEREKLEAALRQPAVEGKPVVDRAQTEARLTALPAEQQQLEQLLAQQTEAGAAAARQVERLKAEIAPLQASLEQVRAERKQVTDTAKQALGEVRQQSDKVRAEQAGVSQQRDVGFEELGGVLAAAGAGNAALAAEKSALDAAEQAQSALQAQYNSSMSQSAAMPPGTMKKFGGLMAVAFLAVAAAAYAANKASQSFNNPANSASQASQSPPAAQDCRQNYNRKKSPVVADPGGPYEVLRGGVARLDGTKSKGTCLTYTWTFSAPDKPDPPPNAATANAEDDAIFKAAAAMACPAGTSGNPGAQKMGPVAPTTFLCSLKVTLTVTDGSSTDRKDVNVKVKPRGPKDWQTSVDTKQTETTKAGSRLIRARPGELQTDLVFGTNVCAIDNNPGHAIHAGSSWSGVGYKTTSVMDAGGPFDGWWYLSSSDLKIKRAAQLNADLDPNSAVFKENVKRKTDMATLRNAVLQHEQLHGTIIFETIKKFQNEGNDPAKIIEALSVAMEEKPLVDTADMTIRQVESHLYPGQQSQEYIDNHVRIKSELSRNPGFNRSGNIALPDGGGNYGTFSIPNIAAAGENGG